MELMPKQKCLRNDPKGTKCRDQSVIINHWQNGWLQQGKLEIHYWRWRWRWVYMAHSSSVLVRVQGLTRTG
jgi:hypothetical protein